MIQTQQSNPNNNKKQINKKKKLFKNSSGPLHP
jgi:hypothetical protein